MQVSDYPRAVWSHFMQDPMRYEREQGQSYEGEHDQEVEEYLLFGDTPKSFDNGSGFASEPPGALDVEEEQRLLSHTLQPCDDDPGFTSEPPGTLDAEEEQRLLSHTLQPCDDGPEFSSEPMPAAFSACLFLGAALVMGAFLLAIFW